MSSRLCNELHYLCLSCSWGITKIAKCVNHWNVWYGTRFSTSRDVTRLSIFMQLNVTTKYWALDIYALQGWLNTIFMEEMKSKKYRWAMVHAN